MRIVVAPDKFTGSLTAVEAAAAIASGLRDGLPAADVLERPVADGGDGTLDALVAAGWTTSPVEVHGPTGARVGARVGRRGGTAVVELAGCCGRLRLPGGVPAPTTATTRGLGEALLSAIGDGATRVVAAVGGSASTDGGLGLLAALGVRVLDPRGARLDAPADLERAARIDTSGLVPGARGLQLTLATDVSAPLLGPSGAARLFGPQKGATPAEVELLERAMTRWAEVLASHCGRAVADAAGAGAAGGVVAGAIGALHGLLDVDVVPGAAVVLDAIGLDDALAGADVAVVGEGSLDRQTLLGKAPHAVAAAARRHRCRVVAVAGRLDLDAGALRSAGIELVVTLQSLVRVGEDPMRDAAVLARRAGAEVARRLT